MTEKRSHQTKNGRGLKSPNEKGLFGLGAPPRALTAAFLVLGLLATAAAMPSASAAKAPAKDDNRWYQCPTGYMLVSITLDAHYSWPFELAPYDQNGDGWVCVLPL